MAKLYFGPYKDYLRIEQYGLNGNTVWEQGLGRNGDKMESGLSLVRLHRSLDHNKIPGSHIK